MERPTEDRSWKVGNTPTKNQIWLLKKGKAVIAAVTTRLRKFCISINRPQTVFFFKLPVKLLLPYFNKKKIRCAGVGLNCYSSCT